jgi:hypothetical protein
VDGTPVCYRYLRPDHGEVASTRITPRRAPEELSLSRLREVCGTLGRIPLARHGGASVRKAAGHLVARADPTAASTRPFARSSTGTALTRPARTLRTTKHIGDRVPVRARLVEHLGDAPTQRVAAPRFHGVRQPNDLHPGELRRDFGAPTLRLVLGYVMHTSLVRRRVNASSRRSPGKGKRGAARPHPPCLPDDFVTGRVPHRRP